MSTGRWSEPSVEHEARGTEEEISQVIAMSKTSGVAEGFYGLLVGVADQKIRQEFPSA
jgi:hypothetical protein